MLERWERPVLVQRQGDDGQPVSTEEYELRPLWQRALGVAICVGVGAGVTAVTLFARRRNVTRILLGRGPDTSVVLEVANARGRGRVFAREDCTLAQGRGASRARAFQTASC